MNDIKTTDNYIRAADLNRRIITAAQLAQQSLYEMCTGFKEMRDSKLYKELGYQTFEDYCEQETGFKRRQVYNYIQIVERLPDDFVQTSAQIGASKLFLLSTLSEGERVNITQDTNIEEVSYRELKQQIKQIRAEKDQAIADKSAAEAKADVERQKAQSLQREKEVINQQIITLEGKIKDLENRPVEAAVAELPEGAVDAETFKNICRTYDQQIDQIQEDNIKNTQRINREHQQELDRIREEYEKKAETTALQSATAVDDKQVFKAYYANAIDAIERLISFVQSCIGDKAFYESKIIALAKKLKGKN